MLLSIRILNHYYIKPSVDHFLLQQLFSPYDKNPGTCIRNFINVLLYLRAIPYAGTIMMAEYLDNQVCLAEQNSRNGESYPGKRWKDEGGLSAYKTYAKRWLSEVASFMKLSDLEPDNSDNFEDILEDVFMAYLPKITHPTSDIVRYENQCVLFSHEILKNVKGGVRKKIRNYIICKEECKFKRSLRISDKTYKRFFQIPLCLLPEKVKETLISMNVVPARL